MNYICDICSLYTTQPLCIRISEEKVRTAEDKIEINCCKRCGEVLFKRVKKECKGMTIKKTLNHLDLNKSIKRILRG
ncbi:hypothetical protein [Bacillus paralicheniformis]|uniref:hypothetical protein n=1 Tax=Bacillus paralicheniformis TaxID=1648923 RepID=UPI0021D3B3C8|nr:hypothetical protein [Bacillus paralicheniformis]MCU4668532.1 hypothetical protein [Bacillus paralicheniformis]